MLLISFEWKDVISALGIINVITGLVCGALRLLVSRQPYIRQLPERGAAVSE